MINRFIFLSLALCGVGLAGSCSPYVDGFCYTPHPAVAEIRAATTQPVQTQSAASPLMVYAIVVGVRRADSDHHLPLSIEFRLRLDNHGPQAVHFDPRTLDLTNGEFLKFLPPLVAHQFIDVLPDQPVVIEAYFPFPPGLSYDNVDMRNLHLRWVVHIGASLVPQMADFRQVHRYYFDDPYWGLPYGYPYPFYGIGGRVTIR